MIFSFSSESELELVDCCGLNRVLRQRVPGFHNSGAEDFVSQIQLSVAYDVSHSGLLLFQCFFLRNAIFDGHCEHQQ